MMLYGSVIQLRIQLQVPLLLYSYWLAHTLIIMKNTKQKCKEDEVEREISLFISLIKLRSNLKTNYPSMIARKRLLILTRRRFLAFFVQFLIKKKLHITSI